MKTWIDLQSEKLVKDQLPMLLLNSISDGHKDSKGYSMDEITPKVIINPLRNRNFELKAV